jgi:hypothetical protein
VVYNSNELRATHKPLTRHLSTTFLMALPTRRLFPQLILTTTISSSCRIPFTEAFSIRLHPPSSQPRGVHLPPIHQSVDGSAESSGQSITGSIYEMDGSSVVVKLFTKEGCTLCDKVKDVSVDVRYRHSARR